MRHPSGRLAWIFAAFLLLVLVALPSLAQDDQGTSEFPESTVTPGLTVETGSPADEVVLPSDLQTREAFNISEEETPNLGPSTADYIRVIVGLLVVVGTIWGVSVLLKKFVTVRGLATSSDNLKVLTSLSITPTRTLYMIRLGDRILLIGASENGLSTLAEITDPSEVSDFLREFEFKGNFDLNPFRERLKSAMGEEGDDFPVNQDLDTRQRKLKGILDRLKDKDTPGS